ncbi:helicase-associated domain-containing protein [Arthrobacter castelli]|uniref:helicase-associated domain-containing protein n=1 Tax=Arthrobacter castelli TaxID=271431 RepID=UPI00040853D0|nr:helicase-associated domain-containing protein [Arthrobacter castelli]
MSSIRALAADLADRSDASLRELFAARPDLISPPVPDFAALAARASTRISVQRALEDLPVPQTRVLEAVHLLADEDTGRAVSTSDLDPMISGVPPEIIDDILSTLHRLALTFRTEAGRFLPVSSLKEVVGPYPLGLGRSYQNLAANQPEFNRNAVDLVAALIEYGYTVEPADTPRAAADSLQRWVSDHWEALLAAAPPQTNDLLDRFRHSAIGTVPHASRSQENPPHLQESGGPLRWLLARGLLVPLDAEHVELPRPVGAAARGNLFIDHLQLQPPVPELGAVSAARRDNAAYGSVAEILRVLAEMVSSIEEQPVATVRSGGVGVREVRRLSERLRIAEQQTSLFLELAAMASLTFLDPDTSRWVAAPLAAKWLDSPRPEQWAQVAGGWLASGRAPSLVGGQLAGGALINPLSADVARPEAPAVRRRTLEALSALTAEYAGGHADGKLPVLDEESVLARMIWHQPRLRLRFHRLVPGILREAELLGLTGSGAITDVGQSTAGGDLPAAVEQLAAALPKPVDYVLLQADLTAVAPGYLQPALSRELALLSDAEGQGPATTFRFSASSIRRALDAGRDGAGILEFLRAHSATEVPQPLMYLINDTASRHGTLRIGAAGSYLRSDDEDALTVLMSNDEASLLGLRRLAPTVVVSRASAREVAVVLQDLGLAPLIENDDGSAVSAGGPGGTAGATTGRGGSPGATARADGPAGWSKTAVDVEDGGGQHRFGHGAPFSMSPAGNAGAAGDQDEAAASQIATLRSAAPERSVSSGESGPMLNMETLNKAIRLKAPVCLSIVDAAGNHMQQRLVPLSAGGGRVRGYDPGKEVERVISIHRVMDVEMASNPEGR